jgi:hypothetical protein
MMNEYNSSDQLNSCTNEESVKQQMRSIGFTDTEIPYASHIIMTMGKLLDSKLEAKRKTFITKVEEQINSLDSIFSPPTESE